MQSERTFSTDRPRVHPDEDKLGYAPFSRGLASSILKMTPSEGIVISLHGAWGSGKTTAVNFMLHYLSEQADDSDLLTLEFNPWWFSGREDLTRLLISQMMSALGKKEYEELKNKLAALSKILSGLPAETGLPIIGSIVEEFSKKPQLQQLKNEIDKLLLENNQKILVVIDDIDRLSPNEISDLFRTIKAVADFSNVIYFLVFDNDVVVEALEADFVPSGRSYLEKIIQVPFHLPVPDRMSLRMLLFSILDEILADTPEDAFDQQRWTNVYFDGIDPFIRTPREIVRLTNALRATYPSVQGEVNVVDFIAVETLRVFSPEIYHIIRTNKDILVGSSPYSWRDDAQEKNRQEFSDWIDIAPRDQRSTISALLSRLFPAFQHAFGGPSYHSSYRSTWRRDLRICSSGIFSVYFRFAISPDRLSAVEMKLLIDKTDDAQDFSDALMEYSNIHRQDGTTKARAALERLQDFTKHDIPLENIENIVSSLFNIGDSILMEEDERGGLFTFGNDLRIGRIIHQLLDRLPRERRFNILSEAIEEGDALGIIEREVAVFGQEHGKYGASDPVREEDRTVSDSQLATLEEMVLRKIRQSAKAGQLLHNPNLVSILHRWQSWSDDEGEIENWIKMQIDDDVRLAEFLHRFGTVQKSHVVGDRATRSVYRLDPDWIAPFINPDDLIGRAKEIANSQDSPDEFMQAVRQFIREYESKQRGEVPDDQLS